MTRKPSEPSREPDTEEETVSISEREDQFFMAEYGKLKDEHAAFVASSSELLKWAATTSVGVSVWLATVQNFSILAKLHMFPIALDRQVART